MPETANFVRLGTAAITPSIMKVVHGKLPFLKLKFTELDDPAYPHLTDQLEFLANVVEDFAEGVEEDLPYSAVAGAVFALLHAHRQPELIPVTLPSTGLANDSTIVRTVLIENEEAFAAYAERHKMKWAAVTLQP
jgi:hypothetical protein